MARNQITLITDCITQVTDTVLIGGKIGKGRPAFFDQVTWSQFDLQAALAGTDVDGVKLLGGLMDVGGKMFFHADRRAASPDVAGEWQQLFDMNHFATFVAGNLGRLFQIHFASAGNDTDQITVLIAVQDEGFENLFDVFA